MSKYHRLKNSMINLLKHNKDGAYRTQADRQKSLLSFAEQVYQLGFQIDHVKNIKTKHIWRVIDFWKDEGISPGTIKNRMSHIRWLVGKLGNQIKIPSNDSLQIPKRQYVTAEDKSRELTDNDLAQIKDPHIALSLRAQRDFGLRMEESMKIQPYIADQEYQLYIKGSWAKGGRDRYIPITTDSQRQWLDEAKALVPSKTHSLIPAHKSYKTHRECFYKTCQRRGIHHLHGHRHYFAQQAYQQITDFACPAKGGSKVSEMSAEQKRLDRYARAVVSQYLGHVRPEILKVYLAG